MSEVIKTGTDFRIWRRRCGLTVTLATDALAVCRRTISTCGMLVAFCNP